MIYLKLSSDIKTIKGVGPARARLLGNLGIKTVEDALFFFPRDYLDLTPLNFKLCHEDKIGAYPCIVTGSAFSMKTRNGIVITKLPITDGHNNGYAVFFNQPYITRNFKIKDRVLFIGKMTKSFGEYQLSNPEWQKFDKNEAVKIDPIMPIYPLTKGITQKVMRKIIKNILEVISNVNEILPEEILLDYALLPKIEALKNIHFPENENMLKRAQARLAFEELLLFQLAMITDKCHLLGEKRKNIYKNFDLMPFLSSLPFKLTSGQKKVISDIIKDLKSNKNMNRLVQGDVGSGKTVVACVALYLAVLNGFQGAFMAPTEILADQHFSTLKNLLNPHGIKVEILKGGFTEKVRAKILSRLKSNDIDIIVGTHALLQQDVEFYKLGMIVTDEQHRFGVNQRKNLIEKGQYPDVLVMSATPIPRTLALVLYSDLDISTIDTLPKGRQKVDTYVVGKDMRKRIYDFMESEIKKGNLAYVICPAVEKNELNLTNVDEMTKYLRKNYPKLRIEALNGKMKPDDKEKIINQFYEKKIHVLVATTVVEVGVDVPYATLMIVEDAERFGLAQLHQIRGRVGRSSLKSYCILISDSSDNTARARLLFLMKCHDGFKISEKDLELRGPGEFLGIKQHGYNEFKLANFVKDIKLFEITKKLANNIISSNALSKPEYQSIKLLLNERLQI